MSTARLLDEAVTKGGHKSAQDAWIHRALSYAGFVKEGPVWVLDTGLVRFTLRLSTYKQAEGSELSHFWCATQCSRVMHPSEGHQLIVFGSDTEAIAAIPKLCDVSPGWVPARAYKAVPLQSLPAARRKTPTVLYSEICDKIKHENEWP